MTTYRYKICPICGIHYGVDEVVMAYKRALPSTDKDRGWHCPNGHSLVNAESEADKWRKKAERLQQDNARLGDEAAAERRRAEMAQRETKRIKKRAEEALCPCCNRHFSQLERHMKSKHPEIATLPRKATAKS